MNRRAILMGGAALAGAALATAATAAPHHHHAGGDDALSAALADCIQKGQVCLAHCHDLLGEGHKAMAACAKSVSQMLTLCTALQQLSNQQSPLTAKLAGLAQEACRQCEDECSKHADMHQVCKDCGESCAACAKACGKVAA